MKRLLLTAAAALAVQGAMAQEAVRQAPAPPSAGANATNGGAAATPENSAAAPASSAADGADDGAAYPGDEEPRTPEAEEARRQEIWNSPEMRDARSYVLAYSARLAGSSRSKGEQYLRRVAELSPEGMERWLAELQRRRAILERQQRIAEEARQLSVEQAVARQEASQQAAFNAQQARNWMEALWQQRAVERAMAEASRHERRAERSAQLAGQRLVYDPFAPTLDPASPGAYERYAAAASLPGDLPRGDPANFYRGDDRGGNPPPGSDGGVPGSGVGPVGPTGSDAGGGGAGGGSAGAGAGGAGAPSGE